MHRSNEPHPDRNHEEERKKEREREGEREGGKEEIKDNQAVRNWMRTRKRVKRITDRSVPAIVQCKGPSGKQELKWKWGYNRHKKQQIRMDFELYNAWRGSNGNGRRKGAESRVVTWVTHPLPVVEGSRMTGVHPEGLVMRMVRRGAG
jgi:hypothetical protein